MHVVEEVFAALTIMALFLSTVVFAVDVLIKGRHRSGPVAGLIVSVIAIPLCLIAFADKLPAHPLEFRGIISDLPGIHQSNESYHSSGVVLVLLFLTLSLRLGIYTWLFIIPAFTLPEAEYHSRRQTASRASDLSAPVLGYLGFALATTAFTAGCYGLPFAVGITLCLLLLFTYFATAFIRKLEKAVATVMAQILIFAMNLRLIVNAIVIRVVVFLGLLEKWRTRPQPGDELFFAELEQRMRRTEQRIRRKIAEREQELEVLTTDNEED